jgi:hypothetical protein
MSHSSDATKLAANDSALVPFRFIDVHAGAARLISGEAEKWGKVIRAANIKPDS